MTINYTDNYNLAMPVPKTENNIWGPPLNDNWQILDDVLADIQIQVNLRNSNDYKDSVRVRASVDINTGIAPATIDGVTMVVNDSFLATNQAAPSQNGWYTWLGAGVAATRRADADISAEVTSGAITPIAEGTSAGELWQLTTPDPITLNSTDLKFAKVTAIPIDKVYKTVNSGAFPYTVVNNDASKVLALNNGASNVNVNIGTVMNLNQEFNIIVLGSGNVTLNAAGGVTLNSPYGLVLSVQYGLVNVKKYNSTTWHVTLVSYPVATAAQFLNNTSNKLLSTDKVWSAAAPVTLTDAATVLVDMNTFINADLTLGGNRQLGQPTNTKVGQSGAIRIIQDGTGTRTLSYHGDWKFAGGTAPILSTAANAVDVLSYQVLANSKIFGVLTKDVK